MTNNNDITAEVLPWGTDHLICKCGHAWGQHFNGPGSGCSTPFCNCNA